MCPEAKMDTPVSPSQVSNDVMSMYERIYGKPLDLSKAMVDLTAQDD